MSARASRSSAAAAAAAAEAATAETPRGKQTRGSAAAKDTNGAASAGSHKKPAAASSSSPASAHTPSRREAFAAKVAAVAAASSPPAAAASKSSSSGRASTAAASSARGSAAALPTRSPTRGAALVTNPDELDDDPMGGGGGGAAASASSSARKGRGQNSNPFAAAATPATGKSAAIKRLAATLKAAHAAHAADSNRCTECAGARSRNGDCINPNCSSNPAFMPPFKRGPDGQMRCTAYPCSWVPLPTGPDGALECHGPRCDSDSAKRRRDREARAEAEERKRNPPPPPMPTPVAKAPKTKPAAAASARSSKAAGGTTSSSSSSASESSSSSSDSDDSSIKPTASKRGRHRKQIASYLDPLDRDNSDDEDFVGSKTKRGSAAASSPSPSKPPPPPKVDVRDTDLSRAIAASLAAAAPEEVAFVASVRTLNTPATLYDEQLLTDPRHRDTLVTASYVVNPEHAVPAGYRSVEEAKAAEQAAEEGMSDAPQEEKQSSASRRASKSAAAAAAAAPPLPLPILHPASGFASACSSESSQDLQQRAAAFDTVWTSIQRSLQDAITSQEMVVFRNVIQFATESFADLGQADTTTAAVSGDAVTAVTEGAAAAGGSAQSVGIRGNLSLSSVSYNYLATHYVHPSASADVAMGSSSPSAAASASQRLPSSHALPVALVHASTNHEDHPLLMAGLKQTIDSIDQARRASARSIRRSRRGRRTAATQAFLDRKLSGAPVVQYRGIREAKNLGMLLSEDEDDDEDSGEDEEESHDATTAAVDVDGAGNSGAASAAASSGAQGKHPQQSSAHFAPFPTPLPFVVTLPSNPASLSALFHSLHASLLSSYPSPRSLSSGSGAAAGAKGSKRDEKKKEDVEFVIAALAQWMQEHREEQRLKYEQWKDRRDKWRASQNNGGTAVASVPEQKDHAAERDDVPVPMDLDSEDESSRQSKSNKKHKKNPATATNKKQKGAAPPSTTAATAGAAGAMEGAAASFAPASVVPVRYPPHLPIPPSSTAAGSSERTPSSIYPRLLLLFPSFCTFPRSILLDFLTLLTEHPTLSAWDEIFPFVLVWPLSGSGDAVRAMVGGELTRRLWPGVFRLPSASAIMASLVARLFQHRATASSGAGDDDTSAGSSGFGSARSMLPHRSSVGGELCCPFTLGPGPMRFLLESFRDEHTSVGRSLAVIKFALMDLMDAQGGEYYQREMQRRDAILPAGGASAGASSSSAVAAAAASSSSFSDAAPPLARVGPAMSCSLSGSYLRAWMRQLSRASRIAHLASAAGAAARARASTAGIDVALLLQRPDPIVAWAQGLRLSQLRELAALPSMASLALGPLSESDGSAARFRSRLPELALALDAQRLGLYAAAGILLQLAQAVGFFGGVAALAATTAKENAATVAEEESGISEQTTLWMHVLSNPVFLPAVPTSAAAAATTPILRLHPASTALFSRSSAGARNALTGLRVPASLDALLLASEHPDALRKILDTGLAKQITSMEAQRSALKLRDAAARSDGSESPAVRVLSAAIATWKEQLEMLRSGADETPASAAAAPAAAPARAPVSGPASRIAKLHAASGITAALSRGLRASSAAMLALHRFSQTLLRPLSAVPLGELITYDRPFRLRAAFAPQQEAAVYRALVSPEMYLGEGIDLNVPAQLRRPAMPASSSSSSAAASKSLFSALSSGSGSLIDSRSPDISVAFDGLARTNGVFVNLKDWFDAFKAVLRDHRDAEPVPAAARDSKGKKGVKRSRGAAADSSAGGASASSAAAAAVVPVDPLADSSLQVRFLSCLATLANLGYIKPTNRRVDHVLKLALQRPY